jgi:hypothetical protein
LSYVCCPGCFCVRSRESSGRSRRTSDASCPFHSFLASSSHADDGDALLRRESAGCREGDVQRRRPVLVLSWRSMGLTEGRARRRGPFERRRGGGEERKGGRGEVDGCEDGRFWRRRGGRRVRWWSGSGGSEVGVSLRRGEEERERGGRTAVPVAVSLPERASPRPA